MSSYAIDAGDDILAPMMKRVLLRAIAIGKRRGRLKDGTLDGNPIFMPAQLPPG